MEATAIKLFITVIVITTALTITLHINGENNDPSSLNSRRPSAAEVDDEPPSSSRRVSRFLAEEKNLNRNPKAVDHCKKDNDICYTLEGGKNSTCCGNKCTDLGTDKHNCGACKNKCKFTHSCCRGECANLYYDKHHCGACGNSCMTGGYCIYGMCDYA